MTEGDITTARQPMRGAARSALGRRAVPGALLTALLLCIHAQHGRADCRPAENNRSCESSSSGRQLQGLQEQLQRLQQEARPLQLKLEWMGDASSSVREVLEARLQEIEARRQALLAKQQCPQELGRATAPSSAK